MSDEASTALEKHHLVEQELQDETGKQDSVHDEHIARREHAAMEQREEAASIWQRVDVSTQSFTFVARHTLLMRPCNHSVTRQIEIVCSTLNFTRCLEDVLGVHVKMLGNATMNHSILLNGLILIAFVFPEIFGIIITDSQGGVPGSHGESS